MVLGSAYDILWRGWAPRVCYVDNPLGHSCGKPFEPEDQRYCVRSALELLGAAPPQQDGLLRTVCEGGTEGLHAAHFGR